MKEDKAEKNFTTEPQKSQSKKNLIAKEPKGAENVGARFIASIVDIQGGKHVGKQNNGDSRFVPLSLSSSNLGSDGESRNLGAKRPQSEL